MSKRCELQKEYYQQYGNYKGKGKYSDKYVSWLENEVLALRQPLVSGSSLPRLFVAENQEFVIEGQIFTWYFSNKELRQGIVLNRKGMIEPSKFTVTVAKK